MPLRRTLADENDLLCVIPGKATGLALASLDRRSWLPRNYYVSRPSLTPLAGAVYRQPHVQSSQEKEML